MGRRVSSLIVMEVLATGLIIGLGWFTLKISATVLVRVAKILTKEEL